MPYTIISTTLKDSKEFLRLFQLTFNDDSSHANQSLTVFKQGLDCFVSISANMEFYSIWSYNLGQSTCK